MPSHAKNISERINMKGMYMKGNVQEIIAYVEGNHRLGTITGGKETFHKTIFKTLGHFLMKMISS